MRIFFKNTYSAKHLQTPASEIWSEYLNELANLKFGANMKQIWSEFEMDLKKLEADVKRIWSQCEANLTQIRSKCETNRKPGSELKRINKKTCLVERTEMNSFVI